jgi:hypothetical protein
VEADEGSDSLFQFLCRAVYAAAELLFCLQREPSFDQGSDAGLVELALDEVSLPVARYEAQVDLFGALIDQGDGVDEGPLRFGLGRAGGAACVCGAAG